MPPFCQDILLISILDSTNRKLSFQDWENKPSRESVCFLREVTWSPVLLSWWKLGLLFRGISNVFKYYIQIYLKNWGLCFFYLKNFEELAFTLNQSSMHLTRLLKQPSCSGLSLCPPISFSTSIYLPPIEITVTADEVYQVYQTKTAAPTSKWTQMEGIHLDTTRVTFLTQVTTNLGGC